MSAREQIFAGIKSALAPLPHREPCPVVPHGVADPQWLAGEVDDAALFTKRATAAGTTVFASAGDCLSWLFENRAAKVYVPDSLRDVTAKFDGMVELVHEYSRAQVDEIDAALTPAAGAIAESGSIILTDESTPDRLAALAPWTHIAVVRRETIFRSVADALAAMPDDPNIIWVTGPSKTADVEGILIQGVHGPGVQGCLLV
ncbi:MAG: LUD domain-containing protein [Chthoniobacterales bacterium]|nr:LUD domain-containing protein [Chthoniobacterales bacterium]